ncbi:hypothetical protein Dimus_010692 [Dionaea muscipula]
MRSLSPSSLVADDRDDSRVVILVGADALTLMEKKPWTVASLACGSEDFTQARCGDMVMADWSGEQGGEQGGASWGGVERTSPQVRNLCSSCSEYDAIIVSGPQVSAEGLDFSIGRVVMELHRAFPFPDGGTRPVVAGDLCGPNLPLSYGMVGQSDGGPPPSSPVVPESGAEGGVRMEGDSGCCSYAHVVQVDRRADAHVTQLSMVGRRGLSQRRVVVDNFDSRSSGPRHPVMFRGSPSPPTTFHRHAALSPGPQARHLRSPSQLLRSSVDPDEFSTSEVGDGDSTEMTVTSEEEEGDGHRGEEDGRPGLSPELDLCPILENESNLGGSSSSISRSPPL